MRNRFIAVLVVVLGLAVGSFGQTPVPPVQHFVMSTTAGSFNGDPVAIVSGGVQLTKSVSVAYEFISNPNDSSKPRVGSGLANYTLQLSSILPASLRSKLLIDTTNYNLTFQAGAGKETLFNGIGNPRTSHVVGNFGLYPSYPLPGGHTQVAVGPKWIVGPHGGLVKMAAASINYTF